MNEERKDDDNDQERNFFSRSSDARSFPSTIFDEKMRSDLLKIERKKKKRELSNYVREWQSIDRDKSNNFCNLSLVTFRRTKQTAFIRERGSVLDFAQ